MSGIITGAEGGVGSIFNMMPRLIVRLIKNTKEGNITEARRDQLQVQQFARARNIYGKLNFLTNTLNPLKRDGYTVIIQNVNYVAFRFFP